MIGIIKKIANRSRIYIGRIFYRAYFKRQMKKNPNSCLVYLPERGIGDVCIAMSYMKAYKNSLDKAIVLYLCNLESLRAIAPVYNGYNEVKYISAKKMDRIRATLSHNKYWNWYEKQHSAKKLIIASPWAYVPWGMLYYRKLDCLSLLADTAYRLEGECRIEFPKLEMKDFPKDGCKKVLFNPFSNSMTVPPETFSPIAEYFKTLGYELYTNCKDEKEYCLPGTKPYTSTIIELYQNAKQFEYIVSIRSGILDLLASTGVKQIVFYNGIDFFNLYSMKMWGCVDVLELMYDDKGAMQKIKAFVEDRSGS